MSVDETINEFKQRHPNWTIEVRDTRGLHKIIGVGDNGRRIVKHATKENHLVADPVSDRIQEIERQLSDGISDETRQRWEKIEQQFADFPRDWYLERPVTIRSGIETYGDWRLRSDATDTVPEQFVPVIDAAGKLLDPDTTDSQRTFYDAVAEDEEYSLESWSPKQITTESGEQYWTKTNRIMSIKLAFRLFAAHRAE